MRGIGIMGGLQIFRSLVGFAVTIVLYRLLDPASFGTFAVCESVVVFLAIFIDLGMEDVTVQRTTEDEAELKQSAFVVSFVSTCIFFLISFFGAPHLAAFVGHPEIGHPLRILSGTFIFNNPDGLQDDPLLTD